MGNRDLGPVDLAVAGLAPQLEHGLVDEPEPMATAGRELPAVGVEGELNPS